MVVKSMQEHEQDMLMLGFCTVRLSGRQASGGTGPGMAPH
jgi:hypothetical protein